MPDLKTIALPAIAFAALAASSVLADAPAMPATKDLHITKVCSHYGEPAPTYCQITSSNVPEIPKGTKIWYWGPDLGINDLAMFATSAIIDVGQDNLASGFCMGDQRHADRQPGMCGFTAGSGTLSGFHALINVMGGGAGDVHWDGFYWFDGK